MAACSELVEGRGLFAELVRTNHPGLRPSASVKPQRDGPLLGRRGFKFEENKGPTLANASSDLLL